MDELIDGYMQCINWYIKKLIERWIDGRWTDGWMDWCLNGLMNGRIDKWVNWRTDECMNTLMWWCRNWWMNEWPHEFMDGLINYWTNG